MDADAATLLTRIIREVRVAALGTLRQGAPLVSMVTFLPEADFGGFCLRVSRLAWHTQDMVVDPRVSLSIVEPDDGRADPQTLARVALRGEVVQLSGEGKSFERLKADWLTRFPESAVTFGLADFGFWRLVPRDARFVAGLGRTYNLSAELLRRAAI